MIIAIYNHQHQRSGCPGCSQTYVKGMIFDEERCKSRAAAIYGSDCEFVNYTDLGDYPASNLERPGYNRMMQDVKAGKLDVIIVVTLGKISDSVDLVLKTYKICKEHHVELVTATDGKRAMEVLDKALLTWEEK